MSKPFLNDVKVPFLKISLKQNVSDRTYHLFDIGVLPMSLHMLTEGIRLVNDEK